MDPQNTNDVNFWTHKGTKVRDPQNLTHSWRIYGLLFLSSDMIPIDFESVITEKYSTNIKNPDIDHSMSSNIFYRQAKFLLKF